TSSAPKPATPARHPWELNWRIVGVNTGDSIQFICDNLPTGTFFVDIHQSNRASADGRLKEVRPQWLRIRRRFLHARVKLLKRQEAPRPSPAAGRSPNQARTSASFRAVRYRSVQHSASCRFNY